MHKLKEALIESYAGGILIALVAANGVSALAQTILATISFVLANRVDEPRYTQPLPQIVLFGLTNVLMYGLVAFALTKWLFFTENTEPSADIDIPSEPESE